jgi:hypothetical protein
LGLLKELFQKIAANKSFVMKKHILVILILPILYLGCNDQQSTIQYVDVPVSIESPSPTPSLSPVALNPKIQFWVADNNGGNFLYETTDQGKTYSNITLDTSMSVVGTVAVSGLNVVLFGSDSNGNPLLETSSDNWTTHSEVDVSTLVASGFNVTNLNLSGSYILLSGSDVNGKVEMQLSTDYGQSFTQLSITGAVSGNIAYPGGASFDGISILLSTVYNGNVYLYSSVDFQNFVDVTATVGSGECANNELSYNSLSSNNVLANCSSDLVLISDLGQNQTDLTSALTAGDPSITGAANASVSLSGSNMVVIVPTGRSIELGAFSLDLGATFAPLNLPQLTSDQRINTFGIY